MCKLWGYILPLILIAVSELGLYVKTLPKEALFASMPISAVLSIPDAVQAELRLNTPTHLETKPDATTSTPNSTPPTLIKPEIPNITINEENVWKAMDFLAQCESSGKPNALNPKDTDGHPAYGTFQYKIFTWEAMEKEFNYKGDPMNRKDAIEITRRALLKGYLYKWGDTCRKYVFDNLK